MKLHSCKTMFKGQLGMQIIMHTKLLSGSTMVDHADVIKPKMKNIATKEDVQTWKELSPESLYFTDSMDQYMYIFLDHFAGALLGIINTMLMAVLDRVKERYADGNVGMNKLRIFSMIYPGISLLTIVGGTGVLLWFGSHKNF